MLSDSQEKEKLILEDKENKEDSLEQCQGPCKKYVCTEIPYESTLNPNQLNKYYKYQD